MSNEQLLQENDVLLSTTDTSSTIKYANPKFCEIAGFSSDELIGRYHNVVRHKDMPKGAFKNMWSFIEDGHSWMGPVKNRCKNGDYYWVNAYVTPIKDNQGNIFEYQSVRTKPERPVVNRAEKIYQKMVDDQPVNLTRYDSTKLVLVMLLVTAVLSMAATVFDSLSGVLLPLNVVLSFVSAFLLSKWRKHYVELKQSSKAVFDNDLMSYLYSGTKDEIGDIKLAFKMRAAELKAITGRVNDVAGSVTDSATQASQTGGKVSQVISEQRVSTEEIATAITQMSCTIEEIAKLVTEAAKESESSLSATSKSAAIVESTIVEINQLSTQLSAANDTVINLANEIQNIESVSNEISSIADQTNLLALNAAIEAARAGEQGRGFSVVAEEVRSLAMRTQQSTEQINNKLTELQAESEKVTQAMRKGNKLSADCVLSSQKTGDALSSINTNINSLAAKNEQIATAVEQQSVAANQISGNVKDITVVANESEKMGMHSSKLSVLVVEKLKEQQNLVEQFS